MRRKTLAGVKGHEPGEKQKALTLVQGRDTEDLNEDWAIESETVKTHLRDTFEVSQEN